MAIKKYLDWQGWLTGLWDAAVPAGATAVVTLLGTNGIAATFGGAVADMGMNWKQALAQIGVHMILAAAKYLQNKPRPQVVEETVQTTFTEKTTTTTETKDK